MKRKHVSCLTVLFLGLFSLASVSYPQVEEICQDGGCFPAQILAGETELLFRNSALYRFWGFRVYTAALYAKSDFKATALFENDTALSLYYHRSLSSDDFRESSLKLLARNPAYIASSMEKEMDTFVSLLEDVESGQIYTMIWKPDEGLELYLDSKKKGTLKNPLLGRLYLEIWLSNFSTRPENFRKLIG